MVDPSPGLTIHDDKDPQQHQESLPGTPRWVKLFGIILLVLILGFVILKLIGVGGSHGPGRHTWSNGIEMLAFSHEMAAMAEFTAANTGIFGLNKADVSGDQPESLVTITGNQIVHVSAPMDAAMPLISGGDVLDRVAGNPPEMLQT